ncbi:hypothetical protein [Paenibacillus sp. ISL-20]|uniref:hypothetical protein n=1 Tax=Paenibacillus sp. ISL-20 TaxID=2819163 RepID=UPI001BECC840|nr:hypothetical protein [Paenibacillus sp. ISL-20]MBT2764578.1 hypothetical protein [Paenibacillus sp. ISL-20]
MNSPLKRSSSHFTTPAAATHPQLLSGAPVQGAATQEQLSQNVRGWIRQIRENLRLQQVVAFGERQ